MANSFAITKKPMDCYHRLSIALKSLSNSYVLPRTRSELDTIKTITALLTYVIGPLSNPLIDERYERSGM